MENTDNAGTQQIQRWIKWSNDAEDEKVRELLKPVAENMVDDNIFEMLKKYVGEMKESQVAMLCKCLVRMNKAGNSKKQKA